MLVTFVTKLDTAVKMSNGNHPVYIQVTYDGTTRKKRIKGYSSKKDHWDFDIQQYNVHEKGFEKKNDFINNYRDHCEKIYNNNFFDDFNYKTFSRLLKGEKKKRVDDKRIMDFCKEFHDQKVELGKVASAKSYIALIPVLKDAGIGNIRLRDFDEACINKLVKRFDQKEIRGYNYLKYLKILYGAAIKQKFVKAKYCPFKGQHNFDGFNIEKRKNKESVRINKKRIKDLTEEEKNLVEDYYYNKTISPLEKKHLAYWMLSYKFFGVNMVDLARLKWTDINNSFWNYSRSKTGYENKLGKPVSDLAMAILKEYDTGGKYILDILNGYEHDPVIEENRLRLYRDKCRKSYIRISQKIGFTDDRYFTFYSGRYTAPTLALTKGMDVNTVRTLMDHASVKTTNKYLGMVRDRKKLEEAMRLI